MNNELVDIVANTLIKASTSFRADKISAYNRLISSESNSNSKWIMEKILENAKVANEVKKPLCDDTGIPHVYIEFGRNKTITGDFIESVQEGIKKGLRLLPGRPMAVKGSEGELLAQSKGLFENPDDLECAPIFLKNVEEDVIRIYVLMEGGGPAIRGKSYRVFHKHNADVVINEIISWAKEAVGQLGCSPCTLAIGIGRSHYEAAVMMLEAQIHGCYDEQSPFEKKITEEVNKAQIGPLGLGGESSVVGTFLKIGPQRASGVRIVCMRPCCCFEPRIACAEIG